MSEFEQRITKLKELLQLEEEKKKCQEAIGSIDKRIAELQRVILGGAPSASVASVVAPAVRRAPRRTRAVRVAKVAPANVAPVKVAPVKVAPVKVAKAPRPTKGEKPKRGAVTERILGALREAGAKGASIKELEAKTGTRYGHLSVWLATTGKKQKGIEKLAPGRYRLRGK
jgi:hypothetical protein